MGHHLVALDMIPSAGVESPAHTLKTPAPVEARGLAHRDQDSMSNTNSTKREGSPARRQTCTDCGRPLTEREQYLSDACERCEREYLLDTLDEDDFPRAA
jgi:hypothetical protein